MPTPGEITQKFNRQYVYLNPEPFLGPYTQRLSNLLPVEIITDGINNLYGIAPIKSTETDTLAHLTFDISGIPNDIWGKRVTYSQGEVAQNFIKYAPYKSELSIGDVKDITANPPVNATTIAGDAVVWFDISEMPNIDEARSPRKMKALLNLPYNSRSITAITATAPLEVDTVANVANVSFSITSLPPV